MIFNGIDWIDRTAKGSFLTALLTMVAGASMVGAFAPFGYWPLIFPGLIWFILPLQSLTLKQTFRRSLWFNLGFYGVGISWVHISIHHYGNAPLLLSLLLTLGFVLVISTFSIASILLLNRYFSHLSLKLYYLLALPFIWLLFEWIRMWFLTGFPWLNLGQSQIDSPLSAIAPVLGSAGISFTIILIVGLVTVLLRSPLKSIKLPASLLVILAVLIVSLQQIQWVEVTDKTLDVSLIQPSVPQEKKWLREQRFETLQYFKQSTEASNSQLIIWPEAAIPAFEHRVQGYLSLIDANAKKKSQAVLTGIPVRDGLNIYNAAIMLGEGKGKYYKQHLVPFGEYIPLESVLRGLIDFLDMPMSAFNSGQAEQALLQYKDWNIAMAICYEIIFQDAVNNQIDGADLLVTLSNDAWFGDSIGPYQHLEMARMRALENGIPVIRSTNDGISALIDHNGNIIQRLGKFKKSVLSGTVTAVSGSTLYRQLGPWWSYFILLIIPALILSLLKFRAIKVKTIE